MISSSTDTAIVPQNETDNEIKTEESEVAAEELSRPEIISYAGKAKLVKMAQDWVSGKYNKYRTQVAREKMKSDLDTADKMLRLSSVDGTQATTQQSNSISKFKSSGYLRRVDIVSAGEHGLIFDGDELPAEYQPRAGDYDMASEEQVKQMNMLAKHTFEMDDRLEKISDFIWYTNAYGNYFSEMGWETQIRTIKAREPLYDEETGEVVGYDFFEQDQIVKDNPTLKLHDPKDVFVDSQIGGFQNQNCVVINDKVTIETLRELQRSGEYTNVDKIDSSKFYRGNDSDEGDDVKEARQANAGEQSESDATGEFMRHTCWAYLPIDDDPEKGAGRSDPSLWDENKNPTKLFKVVFVGPLEGNAVCVQFERNRLPIDEIPLHVGHSHRDNKGFYHDGYVQRSVCAYETECTFWNMGIDNVHLGIKTPFVAEYGNLITTDLKFRDGNQVIYVKPFASATALRQLDIKDMTNIINPMLDRLDAMWDEVFHTQDPIKGEGMGGRTSATEAKGVLSQAMKPALSKARFLLVPFLKWMMRWDRQMWEYFADPERVVHVTMQDMMQDIKPVELYGSTNVRVTAIDRFESDAMKLAEDNQFFQTFWPAFSALAGREGQINFLKRVMKTHKYDTDGLFPAGGETDAEHVALSENQAILQGGVEDYPKQGENHAVHLRAHEQALSLYKLLPQEQQDQFNLRLMEIHVEMTKQLQAAEQAQSQQAAQQQAPQPGGEPQLAGEQNADMMGAQMGAYNA